MCTKMEKIKKIDIFWYFFRLGLFTIGGGYAMIGQIEKELCQKRNWLKEDEFLEIIAVSQSLPGILATNVSTFVGQKIGGKKGSILATLGVSLPSFLILLCLYPLLSKSFEIEALNKFYIGIQAGVIILILNSALSIFKHSVNSTFTRSIFIISLLIIVIFKINPIWIIILGFFSGYLNLIFERKL